MEEINPDYKRISYFTLAGFNWLFNPVGIVIELILGIRAPKEGYIFKEVKRGKVTPSIIPCPHCGTQHDGLTWSVQNGTGTKNWFGLYCPSCGEVISCVMNVFTGLVLLITSPIWFWFYRPLRRKWLKSQKERFTNFTFTDVNS